MKTILTIIALLVAGLSKAQPGEPFFQRDPNRTVAEFAKLCAKDSAGALEDYRQIFQHRAEKDGWIKFIKGGVITSGYTVYFLQNLNPHKKSWAKGEKKIGYKVAGKISHFYRASDGEENVGSLDISSLDSRWVKDNGEHFPTFDVAVLSCGNSSQDGDGTPDDEVAPQKPVFAAQPAPAPVIITDTIRKTFVIETTVYKNNIIETESQVICPKVYNFQYGVEDYSDDLGYSRGQRRCYDNGYGGAIIGNAGVVISANVGIHSAGTVLVPVDYNGPRYNGSSNCNRQIWQY